MTILGVIGAIIFFIIAWMQVAKTQREHEDPTNTTVVDLDQLRDLCQLGPGQAYVVFTTRQSGYEHQPRRAFLTIDEALAAGISTMKRSKIAYVRIAQNTVERFEFTRPFHNHFGRAEGKKVGSIEIVRV